MTKRKKSALGRGLAALIPDMEAHENGPEPARDYFECDINTIQPNRYQPRKNFSEDELNELTASIKNQGIIQPLVVRQAEQGYELVAGERRLRAAKAAGFSKVSVIVRSISENQLLEMSIVENLQREDLDDIETADAYHRLMTVLNLTQEQVAERVGKSRSAVANFLRLRQLPEQIKTAIIEGTLSMGHARALLGAATPAQQSEAFRIVLKKGLNVRQTEELVKQLQKKKQVLEPEFDTEANYFTELSDDLARYYGRKVKIFRQGEKGRIELEFYDDSDLDHLLDQLKSK